jgi:hypothetical protein
VINEKEVADISHRITIGQKISPEENTCRKLRYAIGL